MTTSIHLKSEQLQAQIAPHGARLETLSFHGGASLVLHVDPEQFPDWRGKYPGAIVGPVANRVGGGRVPLNGAIHQMPCNEGGITALHSGPDGLDMQIWDVAAHSDTMVELTLTLADGHGGLPGNRVFSVTYALEGAVLALTITAQTDAPTPINIAHHPYWRLGASSAHLLDVQGDHYLEVDGDNIPTGAVLPVAGTPFDHRTPKPLDPGIDHNLCMRAGRRDTPDHVATLTGAGGLELRIASTEPGLQVYSGAHLPHMEGTDIAPFAGIALEPQGFPDAVNHAAFPSVICTPTRPYRQLTRYSIAKTT